MKEKITVVIPTLNEERSIGNIIASLREYAKDIIIVDGHSRDQTRQIAESLGARVILDNNKGKGDAIRTSLEHIQTEIVVFIDADGSHDSQDIPRLVQPIIENKADHVVGSRLIGGSSELHGGFDEFFRLSGSSFITALINWKLNVRISDSQNGFRALTTKCVKALDLSENITTIEQEMTIKTIRRGFRFSEVGAHEHCRLFGTSNIKLSKVWFRYGWSLIKYLYFVR